MIDEDELWRKMGLSIAVASLAWMAWGNQQKLDALSAENIKLRAYIEALNAVLPDKDFQIYRTKPINLKI
ncbi:MAG: hypothetical protein ACRC8A_12570 [Microcoleaceae cyanobacterium]